MEHFGRYELRRRLGVGGMAEVYEAVAIAEHGIEKPLVIKRILEEHSADESFQEMFVDEARVAMRLNHPNVVQVFDFGKADDRYFLAMELVRGKDLAAIIARTKQQDRVIPAGVAVFIAGEAAKGLDHAHRLAGSDGKPLGIVHRDVSPQNILCSTEGAVKVGDFGIAKFNARHGKTQVATVRGKVRYMSPEQAEGERLDPRSDLFSLAVVLYEMVTGQYAFDGRTDLDVLDQVRRCEPRRPSEITNVPSGLEAILLRALSRDPKHRFARGNDFQRELEQFAVDKGLRATSGALAEFLNSLFPEIETRSSAADGVTSILKLPDGKKDRPESRTRMRRVVAADGMPVFVSEEVRLDDPGDTRESAIRREPDRRADEETTAQPHVTAEVTATREASAPGEVTETAMNPAIIPRGQPARDAGTVVRPGAPPPPSPPQAAARATASELRRPSEVATPPRGTPRQPASPPAPPSPAARARVEPARGTATEAAWPPPAGRKTASEPALPRANGAAEPPREDELLVGELWDRAGRAKAPPEDDPPSRPTFERAKINPIVAESLRERKADPLYARVAGIAVAVLVLGFFGYTFVEPHLKKKTVNAGANEPSSLSVIGRTGDHVLVKNARGDTVFSASLPFSKLLLPPGDYSVTVEGPFDNRIVTGPVVVRPGQAAIFDSNAEKTSPPPSISPTPAEGPTRKKATP